MAGTAPVPVFFRVLKRINSHLNNFNNPLISFFHSLTLSLSLFSFFIIERYNGSSPHSHTDISSMYEALTEEKKCIYIFIYIWMASACPPFKEEGPARIKCSDYSNIIIGADGLSYWGF